MSSPGAARAGRGEPEAGLADAGGFGQGGAADRSVRRGRPNPVRYVVGTLDDQSRALLRRLYTAAVAMVVVSLVGAVGYHTLGGGRWSFSDCLYMSIVTLSTVGFAETLPEMAAVPWTRPWTVVLIVLGSGTLVYFGSTFTALLVEGDLQGAIRRRRMHALIERLDQHVIVCGAGSTGIHVIEELSRSKTRFVVIDSDHDRVERAAALVGADLLYVIGDATRDDVLEEAGIRRATGLIAALTDDRENLFIVVSARSLNERLRIVSKAVDTENVAKLERAGANAVVTPAYIGGVRLASEMVRPSVIRMLDRMAQGRDEDRRMEEVVIDAASPLAGASLGQAGLRESLDSLVIALRHADGRHQYNPPASAVLTPGVALIVLVPPDRVAELRRLLGGAAR